MTDIHQISEDLKHDIFALLVRKHGQKDPTPTRCLVDGEVRYLTFTSITIPLDEHQNSPKHYLLKATLEKDPDRIVLSYVNVDEQ